MKDYKCTAISDTHTHHDTIKLSGGDFLFHTGDISYLGSFEEISNFIDWFYKQPYEYKIFIAGNHDFGLEPLNQGISCNYQGDFVFRGRTLRKGIQEVIKDICITKDIIYLDKSGILIEGINIYGIPDQPAFCGWAFNYEHEGEYAKQIFKAIPKDTDILLTHTPPRGHLDRPLQWGDDRLGCPILRKAVDKIKPKVHIFGHIHESYGVKKLKHTLFINAAYCSIPYTNFNSPIDFIFSK